MVDFFVRILGLNQAHAAEWTVLAFCTILLTLLVSLAIDALTDEVSFGISGNAAVLLAGTLAGLVAFAQFVLPLRHVSLGHILTVAVLSAALAFLTLGYARMSAARH